VKRFEHLRPTPPRPLLFPFRRMGDHFSPVAANRKVISLERRVRQTCRGFFSGHENRVRTVAFARDSAHFLSGFGRRHAALWNISL
jgi:hypothetical protein